MEDLTKKKEEDYPMKFKTMRKRINELNAKSANALSFVTFVSFFGSTCILKETARTNDPTVEMKPLRNELKGNVPAMMTYTN